MSLDTLKSRLPDCARDLTRGARPRARFAYVVGVFAKRSISTSQGITRKAEDLMGEGALI